MTFSGFRALVALWCILLGAAAARSSTIILTPVADTTLFQVATNNNLGGTTNFVGGTTASGARGRAVIRFALTNLPSSAIVTSARLSLTDISPTSGTFTASNFQLRRLLVDWGEGTGTGNTGTAALTGEATWTSRFHNVALWATPGAASGTDYVETASSTAFVNSSGVTTTWESTPQLVADVQLWLTNAAANFGWILISDAEGTLQTSRRFASREAQLSLQPKLTLEFTVPPVTAVLAPVADTGLREYDPNTSMGGEKFFPVGTTSSSGNYTRNRGLVRFDLAANLPSNAVIMSATLNLRVTKDNRGAVTAVPHDLHRVLRAWGEGTNTGFLGSPAMTNDATWNSRLHGIATWVTPGGEPDTDFVSEASATTTLGYTNVGGYNFTSPQLLGDAQAWLNLPGTNFGWMVISQFEGALGAARRIGSREDPANAPRLTLVYVSPDATDPPMLTMLGTINDFFQLSFIGEAGRSYFVQKRDSLTSGDWATFSNLGPLVIATNLVVTDAMTPSNSFYRVIKN
jgi:hypothetical protein